jgi:hypothetical protein
VIVLNAAFAQNSDPSAIKEGLGIPGMIQIGWSEERLVKAIGRGKKSSHVYKECVRSRSTYRYYEDVDITAYTDYYSDPREPKGNSIVAIRFGPGSKGMTDRGIVINRSTRQDVYAHYGQLKDNSTAYYDIGIWFEFDLGRGGYSQNDTVREIGVSVPVVDGEF